jgi:hypothetical protein
MEIYLRIKEKYMKKVFLAFVFLFLVSAVAYPQVVTTAGLEIANTFQQLNTFLAGISIGNVKILPGSATYSLTLPSQQPAANSLVAVSNTPGVLTFAPSCGAFTANGDLGGNATSQIVVGINGIAIDTTVTPTDGMTLKYSAAKNKWVPSL